MDPGLVSPGKKRFARTFFFVAIIGISGISPEKRHSLHLGENYYIKPVEMDAMVLGNSNKPGFSYREYELLVPGYVTRDTSVSAGPGENRGSSLMNEELP
jgi:hypothetical protein